MASAGFQLEGDVVNIGRTQQVSASFKKREIVLVDKSNAQYPEYAVFQFVQDKCTVLDNYKVGDKITIHFNIKGRPFQKAGEPTKYFSNLQGWKIEGQGSGGGTSTTTVTTPSYVKPPEEDDDLPF
jgi:hypothetical protein